jgi:hypothetical protein
MNTREINLEMKKSANLLSKGEFEVFKSSLPKHSVELTKAQRLKKVKFLRSKIQKLETQIKKQRIDSKRQGKIDKPKLMRSQEKKRILRDALGRLKKAPKVLSQKQLPKKSTAVKSARKSIPTTDQINLPKINFKRTQRRLAAGGMKRINAHSQARNQRNQKKRDSR